MKHCKCKHKLHLNTQKEIEELYLRLELEKDQMLRLELLAAFRPGASLRSINNTRRANLYARSQS